MMCRDIEINDDMICEGNEDFELLLESGPDGGTTITNSPGSVFIVDDDGKKKLILLMDLFANGCRNVHAGV